jgi:c(7)-type cytochrome triheme protein
MKKICTVVIAIAVVFVLAASAFAVAPGKTLEFEKGGKVVFTGDAHKAAKCADCHSNPALFKMKKGGDMMTMKDMEAGKFCGACHNGTKAFAIKDNCAKCHKK